MMVWIGYEVYYDYCNTHRYAEKVFDCEEKAIAWKSEFKETRTDWREYERMDVE